MTLLGPERRVDGNDLVVVAGQLGRPPHPISRVACRCPFGLPAVVEDVPCDERGKPFPTLFYATCPTLVAAVGRLESEGGVRRLQGRLDEEPALQASLAAALRYTHRRRRELARAAGCHMADGGASLLSGLGGEREPRVVKCLHVHAAHALARPGYLPGEAVLEEAGDPWCDDARCRSFLPAPQPTGAPRSADARISSEKRASTPAEPHR